MSPRPRSRRSRRSGAARDLEVVSRSSKIVQIWRDGRKQALLARILSGIGVRALAPGDDTRIGELLAVTRTDGVLDGHVALLADDTDRVLTSDPDDLARLIAPRGVDAEVVTI